MLVLNCQRLEVLLSASKLLLAPLPDHGEQDANLALEQSDVGSLHSFDDDVDQVDERLVALLLRDHLLLPLE